MEQYLSYLPFAYKMGLVQGGSEDANKLEGYQKTCNQALSDGGGNEHVDYGVCEVLLRQILEVTRNRKDNTCYNMYDVRLHDEFDSCGMNWPPDLETVTPYLQRTDVTAALNIDSDKRTGWHECSGAVSGNFRARNSKPSVQFLPDLLGEMPVVLFSGEQDLICNHLGTEEIINNLEWNGGKGFELSPGTWAPRRDWVFEGESAGIYQEARNLTYVLFYNSSHMVPFDYPRRTRDMLDRFIGVDIASIGGQPADSRIDGEKGLETSVGGHPNSTIAEEEEEEKLKEATWKAYYKSGEVALVVVIIAAVAWGYFVWRDRRRRAGYTGLGRNGHAVGANGGLEAFRNKPGDVEAQRYADESELDDLTASEERQQEPYSIGEDDESDEEDAKKGRDEHQ